MSFNHVIHEGWVQKEPDVKEFESGAIAATITLSKYTGVKKEDGTSLNKFIRVRFAGKPSKDGKTKTMIENALDLKQGDRIVVSGKMDYYKRTHKETGAEELSEYIFADSYRVFGHSEPRQKTQSAIPKATAEDFPEDDIPF